MSLRTFVMGQGSFEVPDAIKYLRNVANLIWTKAVIGTVKKPAVDAQAADETAETVIPFPEVAGTVSAVWLKAESAGLTAAATHTATVSVYKRAAAGGSQALVASLVTNVAGGDWTQFVKKSLALSGTAANLDRLATDTFTYTVTKQGNGKVTPSFTLQVEVEPTVPST